MDPHGGGPTGLFAGGGGGGGNEPPRSKTPGGGGAGNVSNGPGSPGIDGRRWRRPGAYGVIILRYLPGGGGGAC